MKFSHKAKNNDESKASPSVLLIWLTGIIFSTLCISSEKFSPQKTLLNPYLQKKHVIHDLRSNFMKYKITNREEMPVPGGKGAGILYRNGSLQVFEHAELHTKMFVHPNGLNPSGSLNWLYTTATNRTDDSIEVVGIYAGWKEFGYLGIWDWSCNNDYPCQNGSSAPGFQWSTPFSEFECNMTEIVDQGGHYQTIIQYANISKKLDEEDPPLWLHEVMLWNYCNESWDLIYEHESRYNKLDCSLESNTCAFWGPILETFGDDPYPEINELGFADTLLYHDGIWSELSNEEASFKDPITPWELFHLDPNRGYGVGNYVNFAPPVANFSTDIKSGEIPVTVSFTDESLWSVTDWLWDFGDNRTSTEKNPVHTYYDPGIFTVSLTVTGPGGTDNDTKTDYIVANYEALLADFTADNTTGTVPHTVNFTDKSSGTITDWRWDFGDRKTSTMQNPQHVYNNKGIYTVTLTIWGPAGSNAAVKSSFIVVTAIDSDQDGVPDQTDGCANDPNKTEPGVCGCGFADTDLDSDGIVDCKDKCPDDPNNDIDNDNICGDLDCNDNDATIYPGATEICGDGIDQDCNGMDLVCPEGEDDNTSNTPAVVSGDDKGGSGCTIGSLNQ